MWYIYIIKSEIYHTTGGWVYEIKTLFIWLMGLLSLLGFIGIFTEAKSFLAFFAFAVDFEYFFIKSDEMLEEYMNKSASRAFYCGMISVALCFFCLFLCWVKRRKEALITGLAFGWAVSVIIYALSTAYYGFKEKWGLENDKE